MGTAEACTAQPRTLSLTQTLTLTLALTLTRRVQLDGGQGDAEGAAEAGDRGAHRRRQGRREDRAGVIHYGSHCHTPSRKHMAHTHTLLWFSGGHQGIRHARADHGDGYGQRHHLQPEDGLRPARAAMWKGV